MWNLWKWSWGLVLAAALAAPGPTASVPQVEEVIDAVQRLFDAMASKNAEAIGELVLPDGRVLAMRGGVAKGIPGSTSLSEFAGAIGASEGLLLERMWDPTVSVEGAVAMLWTRYDFHVSGRFSHCGTDHFSLVQTNDGWKIAGITYTVQRDGCEPSPLGPPQ